MKLLIKELIRFILSAGATGIVVLFLSILAMCGDSCGVWG